MKLKKYKVVCDIFKDLEENHIYKKGEDFPYDDAEIREERINALSTINNKIGIVLIAEKELEDYLYDELVEIAEVEKISQDDIETKDELIERIKKERTAKSKVIKKLKEKEIEFDENSSLEELRKLFKNEK